MVSSYISGALAEKLVELLREAEERVRGLGREIRGDPLEHVGFVDGSYVLEERRGACLALFSAASLEVVRGEMRPRMGGNRKPIVHVLAPKSYSESRASLLMSVLELLAAIDLLRSGAEAVFLDGSYVSALMEPFGFAEKVYSAALRAGKAALDTQLLNRVGADARRSVQSVLEDRDPYTQFTQILATIGRYASELYGGLYGAAEEPRWRKEALDYSLVYLEETAYLTVLHSLLGEAESRGVSLYWVAKDTESRYITEREGVLGWLNDVMLLDYAWKGVGGVYTELKGQTFGRPKGLVAYRPLIDEVYAKWNEYSVVYFKLNRHGVVSQMTYPTALPAAPHRALATLSALSDKLHGYPRPLNYVHNVAVLDPALARVLADEMYRRRGPEDILRYMLAPSGRRMLGLA